MEARLKLKYDGPAVLTGKMPVHAAAATMVAFSEFVVAAAKNTFGADVDVRAEVAGYAPGSFSTDLTFQFGGVAATLLSMGSPKELFDTVKLAFELWKFLKGEPPKSVERNAYGVQVTNNNGQIINVSNSAFTLVLSDRAGEAADGFVRVPLASQGIERLEVSADGEQLGSVTPSEAQYFRPVLADVPVSENKVRMTLIIESVGFRGDLKWRFTDGATSYAADIADDLFLERIDQGEKFGKGDRLDVDLVIEQTRRGEKYSVERTIVRVHEHLPAASQSNLFPHG